MEPVFIFQVLGGALVCAVIGMIAAGTKGNGLAGFAWGFLLGPLGILIAIIIPENPEWIKSRCPRKPARPMALPVDPVDQWEAKEKAKTVLPVPDHLRGRKIDE